MACRPEFSTALQPWNHVGSKAEFLQQSLAAMIAMEVVSEDIVDLIGEKGVEKLTQRPAHDSLPPTFWQETPAAGDEIERSLPPVSMADKSDDAAIDFNDMDADFVTGEIKAR